MKPRKPISLLVVHLAPLLFAFLWLLALWPYNDLFENCEPLSLPFLCSIGLALLILNIVRSFFHRTGRIAGIVALIIYICLIIIPSLTEARSRSSDSAIKSHLSMLRAAVELSSDGVFRGATGCSEFISIYNQYGVPEIVSGTERWSGRRAACISSPEAWAVAAPLFSRNGMPRGILCSVQAEEELVRWCVDSSGFSGEIKSELRGPSCQVPQT